MPGRTRWPVVIICGGITVLSFIVRVAGNRFGLPHHFHPDEDMLINISLRLSEGNDLNPRFFSWGGAHFYITAVTFRMASIAGFLHTTSDAYLVARTLSAALGAASVALAMWIVLRLYASLTLAALTGVLFGFSMLHVRCSHYATVDVAGTFWLLLSIGLLVRSTNTSPANLSWVTAAGAAAGVAAGTKYHLAILVPILATASLLLPGTPLARSRVAIAAAVCVAAAAGFLVSNPFAVLDFNAFAAGIRELVTHYDQPQLHPRNHGEHNWWFFVWTLARGESDAFVLVTATLGIVALVTSERRPYVAALAAFPILTFAFLSSRSANYVRNLLPLMPFLAAFSATGIVALALAYRTSAVRRFAVVAVATCAVLISLARVVRMDVVMLKEDTRQVAGRWLAENLPPQAKIAVEREHWANPPFPEGVQVSAIVLGDYPLSYYRDEDYDYIITNSVSYRAYFLYPDRMPETGARYRQLLESLETQAALVARFNGTALDVPSNDELPNPEIRVYRLLD